MSSIKIISYIMNNKYIFNNPNRIIKNIIYNTPVNKLKNIENDNDAKIFFNNNKDIYIYYNKILQHKNNEIKLKKYNLKLQKEL